MKIQSISIVVPTKRCVNNCPFCVSRMHDNEYVNNFDYSAYKKRIKYAVMNGVTTLIITGTGEAMQNKTFLEKLSEVLESQGHPFPNVELQTTGVFLNQFETYIDEDSGEPINVYKNITLLKSLGVNTVSLSVSDIFNNENNLKIIGTPEKLNFNLSSVITLLKERNFNIRLSLNLLNVYNPTSPDTIIRKCKDLGADQVTFRKMYSNENLITSEDKWVDRYKLKDVKIAEINDFVSSHGEKLYKLPFGADVYSLNGLSIAVDNDCMSKNDTDSLKYVILRENGKLYCRWDDEGSLIF